MNDRTRSNFNPNHHSFSNVTSNYSEITKSEQFGTISHVDRLDDEKCDLNHGVSATIWSVHQIIHIRKIIRKQIILLSNLKIRAKSVHFSCDGPELMAGIKWKKKCQFSFHWKTLSIMAQEINVWRNRNEKWTRIIIPQNVEKTNSKRCRLWTVDTMVVYSIRWLIFSHFSDYVSMMLSAKWLCDIKYKNNTIISPQFVCIQCNMSAWCVNAHFDHYKLCILWLLH